MKIMRIALALVFLYSLEAFAEQKKTYKVAVLKYMQETCTFCPGGDTEIADRSRRVPFVAEKISSSRVVLLVALCTPQHNLTI